MRLPFYPDALKKHKFYCFLSRVDHVSLHYHDYLEFSYVNNGSMKHFFNNKSCILNPGDYYIVDYGTEHAYEQISEEPLEVINLLFLPEFLDRTLVGYHSFEDVVNSYLLRFNYNSLRSNPTGETFHDESGTVKHLIDDIRDEHNDKKYGYYEYIRCLFVELLIQTMRKLSKQDVPDIHDGMILEIVNDMNENYALKPSLSQYAQKYNYSTAYLSKQFKDEMGLTYSTYLQHIRIEHSCRLLQQTDLRINEIAEAVGYNDIKSYNYVFKTTLGITPREYRKTHPFIKNPS